MAVPPRRGHPPTKAISIMNNQSRDAARKSFARQRAHLLFSVAPRPVAFPRKETSRQLGAMPEPRRNIVRKGLIGFVPATLQ
jgi:hypothetical protein